VDLPCYLNALIAALPRGHCYAADQLIDEHSLYPLHAPFLCLRNRKLIRHEMKTESAKGVYFRAGIMAEMRQPERSRMGRASVTLLR
jgi:hypothetical protein